MKAFFALFFLFIRARFAFHASIIGVFLVFYAYFFFLGHFFCFITRKNREFSTVYFFLRDLFEPTPVAFIPPDTRVKKKYSAGILRKRTRPWAPYYPLHQYSILLTCFLILKVNMHAVLSPGTLPRPSMEIGLLEAK